MAESMNRISTHILDVALGKPANDVPVRLERRDVSTGWRVLHSARTDADGRCAQLLPSDDALVPGSYRLVFDTEIYYSAQRIEALYPVVEITFHVRYDETQFHIPLLLSPNSYTTYRGS
jgi:5-hydroxyisourate hydrolase